MTILQQDINSLPSVRVDVIESAGRARAGRLPCKIGGDIKFSTDHLESYCLASWEPLIFDTLVLTAAVEFCDRIYRRQAFVWGRNIELRVPVHEPDRWNAKAVSDALHDALAFLTGDRWAITFVARKKAVAIPRQIMINLPTESCAVIPFSEGLDSRAVAGLLGREMGNSLIRVRLGSKLFAPMAVPPGQTPARQPFTSIPYRVKPTKGIFVESSARSRGFKFAMVSGLAAYLVKADRIIVPESGQGALGPVLVPVGQVYEDYRNHPLFTDRMEKLVTALFNHRVRYEFPQLWYTKGETLTSFAKDCNDDASWADTWSCWQQNRQVSVNGRKRQCGICAACMLRRLSVHAAGLKERTDTYVWENLGALKFEDGAASGFRLISKAQREYAIAGTLHLDHLAAFRHSAANKSAQDLAVAQLSRSRAIPETEIRSKLDHLLNQHEAEWKHFLQDLGKNSFVASWVA